MPIFITGTDTNVGKTIVAAWLCVHLKTTYWKPIQTGTDSDTKKVKELSSTITLKEQFLLKAPLSPYMAAKLENIKIDTNTIFLPSIKNLVIEGAGGIMVPIKKDFFMIDLIEQFSIPSLIVSRSSLGTINHTILTVEALLNRNMPILGIIMNGFCSKELKNTIEELCRIPILDVLPTLEKITPQTLKEKCLSQTLKKVLDYELN